MHLGNRQPYAIVDLNPMPYIVAFIPRQGLVTKENAHRAAEP